MASRNKYGSVSRRGFLKRVGASSAALSAAPMAFGSGEEEHRPLNPAVSTRVSDGAGGREGGELSSNPEPNGGIFLPDPRPSARIEYINPTPPAFRGPEFPGEYYDAVVPATLDLAERASLAIHGLTGMTNPNCDHEMYIDVFHMSRPPAMVHGPSDMDTQGKFVESTALMRVVSGSKENLDVDTTWMEVMLKMQGDDGLLYSPTTGRDWVMYQKLEPGSGSPARSDNPTNQFCLLFFGTPRSIAAMCLFAQMDSSGPWKEAARRLAQGYARLMINKGDNESYLFSTWMYPGRPIEKPAHHPFDENVDFAAFQAWIAQYLVIYDRAFNDPASSKLAERIMNYTIIDRHVLEPDGSFQAGPMMSWGTGAPSAHFHTRAMNILATLYVSRQTGNKGLLDLAMKSYEYAKSKGEPLVGFFPEFTACTDKDIDSQTSETCEIADMIISALTLAKLGHDRCWDEADRWVRNQLAENQLTQINWLTDGHLDYSRSKMPPDFFKSKLLTTDHVAERTLGGFAGWPSANDWVGNKPNILYTIMNCCTASGARAIFAVWRDMLQYDQGSLKVNLLLNRASKWADIDSYIPYTGRVDLKIKEPVNLEVRIPEWVKPGEAHCEVDGNARELTYDGRYAQIGKVGMGQTVVVTFPISERTEKRHIQGSDYTFVIRGNDVVAVDPVGKYYPLYQRGHYRTGKPLYQNVRRFVAQQEVPWW